MRSSILERFRTAYGDRPIALLPTEWIEALLDSKPPHAARSWLITLRSLCEFAVKRRWLRTNPASPLLAGFGCISGSAGEPTFAPRDALSVSRHPAGAP